MIFCVVYPFFIILQMSLWEYQEQASYPPQTIPCPDTVWFAGSFVLRKIKPLGIGIANLINIFNPELIAIGAGVSDAGDLLLDPLKRTLKVRALSTIFPYGED